jgi:D-alanine-D-alanine ligase-like ATP-grasp enzyme
MKSVWEKVTWNEWHLGLYGFDIMPDACDKLWLLEVNKFPSMEENSPVTETLVP